MKKTLIALVALSGLAMADYTWTGGDVIADDSVEAWKNADNWDVSTINGNGPMTTGSNMWDKVIISNGSSIVLSNSVQIEGWVPKMEITNGSSLTVNKMAKIQNGGTFTVGEGSSLVIATLTQGDNGYKGGVTNTFVVDGTLDINFNGPTPDHGTATSITLGGDAAVTLRNLNNVNSVMNVTADLGTPASSEIQLLTRELMTLVNVTLGTVNYDMGANYRESAAPLTATAGDVGKFYVFTEGNKLKVSYVTPEPATATLSLLALAGLAARRRRH